MFDYCPKISYTCGPAKAVLAGLQPKGDFMESQKYKILKKFNDFYVYTHSYGNRGVVYVGMGRVNRAWDYKKRNHLWETFFADCEPIVHIVKKGLTLEEAEKLESSLIAKYLKDKGFLLNIYAGTKKCRPITDARASQILSKFNARHWQGKKRDPETTKKMLATKTRNSSFSRYWQGKKRDSELMDKLKASSMTPEAIEKRAAKMRGKTLSEEHKAKISKSLEGRVHSNETRAKISETKKGRPNGLKGYTWSEEARANLSKARMGIRHDQETLDRIKATKAEKVKNDWVNPKSKPVLCVELNKVFPNARIASEELEGANVKHIQSCCVGRRKTHAGYTWEYSKGNDL
jgi:hypothetical protein